MELERVVYTVDEVATLLNLSKPTVYKGIRKGKIPACYIGRRLIIPILAMNRFLESVGQPASQGK